MQDGESVFKGCAGAHGGDRGFLPGKRDGYRISEQSGRAREKYSQKDGGGYCLDLGGLPEELNKR